MIDWTWNTGFETYIIMLVLVTFYAIFGDIVPVELRTGRARDAINSIIIKIGRTRNFLAFIAVSRLEFETSWAFHTFLCLGIGSWTVFSAHAFSLWICGLFGRADKAFMGFWVIMAEFRAMNTTVCRTIKMCFFWAGNTLIFFRIPDIGFITRNTLSSSIKRMLFWTFIT